MTKYYLAIDIGASSGRHILAHMDGHKMVLEEIYRFSNGMEKKDGSLLWDTEKLFREILTGMRKCSELGKIPVSTGIDTWAVDYVLLDRHDRILGRTYGYRDKRTEGMDLAVYASVPEKELYSRTGIQKQMFNSIYQLMAEKKSNSGHLREAETFLMLPDYFHFLLTGKKVSEYTNATSTQLVKIKTCEWDRDLIRTLGYPEKIFLPLSMPGTEAGELTPEIQKQVGFNCKVVLPATHDTASAVAAVPSLCSDTLYISSGTWSLMGVETEEPICTDESRELNFTNEGGYDLRYRFLKNIMGLWMIQSVRHEMGDACSFAELCEMAEQEKEFPSRVDVNDPMFMAPENMQDAIRNYCRIHHEIIPETAGEIAAVIYQSLSDSYAETIGDIERIMNRSYGEIHIVGGGANADYLNYLTAYKSGKKVSAGPTEATAIGNLAVQMIAGGDFESLAEARKCIRNSFEIKEYNIQRREK